MREWESNVRKVVPYVPGEQPKDQRAIKLNTNENPYPPSPMVEEALRELAAEPMRRYPDSAAQQLVDAIAKEQGVKPEQIFVGIDK